VTHAEVYQSAGHEALDAAAMENAREWKFQPAESQGRPIASVALATVRFVLK
jgi:TonB family protein